MTTFRLILCLIQLALVAAHESFRVHRDAEELEPLRSKSRAYLHHSASFSLASSESYNLFYDAVEHQDHVALLVEPGLERVLCYEDHLVLVLDPQDDGSIAPIINSRLLPRSLRRLDGAEDGETKGALVSGACWESEAQKATRAAAKERAPVFYRRVSREAEVALVRELEEAESSGTRRPLVKLWTTPSRFEEMFDTVDMNLFYRPATLKERPHAKEALMASFEEAALVHPFESASAALASVDPAQPLNRTHARAVLHALALAQLEREHESAGAALRRRRRRLGWFDIVSVIDKAKDFFGSAAASVKAAWDRVSSVIRSALDGEDAKDTIELANIGFNFDPATGRALKPRLTLGEDAFGSSTCVLVCAPSGECRTASCSLVSHPPIKLSGRYSPCAHVVIILCSPPLSLSLSTAPLPRAPRVRAAARRAMRALRKARLR